MTGESDTREATVGGSPARPESRGQEAARTRDPEAAGSSVAGFVDLHAHYATHLQPRARQLTHERLLQWEKEWLRARLVRLLSSRFNYEGNGPGVTVEEMEHGDVGVILSPLNSPLDEIDVLRRYGSRPRPAYFTDLLDQLELVENDVEERHSEGHAVTVAHSIAELQDALNSGQRVLIHAVEGGFHLGDDEHEVREHVRELARRGVAYITVAHLFWRGVATNAPALPFMPDWLYGLLFPQPKAIGLTALGLAAVNAMIDHGVLIDITHMSEQAMSDTLDLLDERDPRRQIPVIATHMACRLLDEELPQRQVQSASKQLEYNLPDEVIRRVGERKGLLGLIACEHYITAGAKPPPRDRDESLQLMKAHIDHILRVIGEGGKRCVAFGSDLDGYIKPALKGLERLSDMRWFQQSLRTSYGDAADQFTHGNALRVLETAWQVPHPAAHRGAAQRSRPVAPQAEASNGSDTLAVIAFLLGLLAYLYLSGLFVERVRLSSARLPADLAPDILSVPRLLSTGLRATLLAGAAFAVLCLIAYVGASLHWSRYGQLWHNLVRRRPLDEHDGGVAPLGETAVRILAGVNTVAIAALVALAPTRFADERLPELTLLVVLIWVISFLALYLALLRWGPAFWGRRVGSVIWTALVVLALFVSAPLGILVLATAFVGTFGRVVARVERPETIGSLVRSPLPWAVLATVLMVALAYAAVPPVSFPTAVVATPAGPLQSGAYLGRTGAGVYIASCRTSQTDATSTVERATVVPNADVRSLTISTEPYRFDSGKRPSLLTLVVHAVGGEGETTTLLNADLRSRARTCGGAGAEGTANDASLGRGVLVRPGPLGGRAIDGERPIQETTPRLIADLAHRYQPTLLVTTADRNWPVSVQAVLAERGSEGATPCLVRAGKKPNCEVKAADLSPAGASASDYLQLPTKLESDSTPEGQFQAFMRGQEIEPGASSRWLDDPGVLKPWGTAQIYFYLADPVERETFPKPAIDHQVQEQMIGLEYWFYYPYNYYPAVVRQKLMEQTPLASESFTADRHQGDWEHVDVLLDRQTLEPKWLYLARHGYEGKFLRWANVAVAEGHPVIQAAYGGHPSYEPDCGPQARERASRFLASVRLTRVLTDWLVCGSGRLGFRANSTPLVDLASVPWACWPGHFGEASRPERAAAEVAEYVRDQFNKIVLVAGPEAPLLQAENKRVCKQGQPTSEQTLLPQLQREAALP
jgi:microsomal dipeptidase-like Zn-dependent dipeptidase